MATECKALRWLAAQAAPVRAGVVCPEWLAAWGAARDANGLCFEDKEGWQYTPHWIKANVAFLQSRVTKLRGAAPRYETAELLSIVVECVYKLARSVRPETKSGKPAGKMLTYVGSWVQQHALEALRWYADGLTVPRKDAPRVAHFGDVRERNGGDLVCEPAAPVPEPVSGFRERMLELARMLPPGERQAVELVYGQSCGVTEASAIMQRARRTVADLLADGLKKLAVLMRNKGLRPPVVRPAVQLTIEGA